MRPVCRSGVIVRANQHDSPLLAATIDKLFRFGKHITAHLDAGHESVKIPVDAGYESAKIPDQHDVPDLST